MHSISFLTGVVWKMPHERGKPWVFWLRHMLRKCSGLHPLCAYPVIHPAGVPTASRGSWWRALWSGFCMICVRCCWGFLGGVWGWRIVSSRERSGLIIARPGVCVLTSLLWEARWAWSRWGRRSSGRIFASGWLRWSRRRCPTCPRQCGETLLKARKWGFRLVLLKKIYKKHIQLFKSSESNILNSNILKYY